MESQIFNVTLERLNDVYTFLQYKYSFSIFSIVLIKTNFNNLNLFNILSKARSAKFFKCLF